jgi:hypothetical protein
MEVEITNPGQSPFIIDVNCEAPSRPVDAHRYAEFKFSADRDYPIQQYAWIKLSERGHVYFRGYVFTWNRKGQKISVNCRGEEELLMHRYSPRMGYELNPFPGSVSGWEYGMHLDEIFSDLAPTATPNTYGNIGVTGMLFLLNSSFPQGQWWLDTWTEHLPVPINGRKLPGFGSDRLGLTPQIYAEGDTITQETVYADFVEVPTDGSKFFIDESDLYLHLDLDHHMAEFRLAWACFNAFDTHIRLGQVDKADTQAYGSMQFNNTRWADIIIDFAEYFKIVPHFRYSANNTYLDLLDEA